MKRAGIFAAGVTFAVSSCVPASEPAPPAGALGFVTEPSPAAQGMPFVTSDGWTVRIERLALQVDVSAMPRDTSQQHSYFGSDIYRFDASQSVELFARALPVGGATASLALYSSYISDSGNDGRDYDAERTTLLGLSPETNARFRRAADISQARGTAYYESPSILLAVRAEKNGRVVTLDLTIDADASPRGSSSGFGDVKANALTTVPQRIVPEVLFMDAPSGEISVFDDFAAADADRDGRVTAAELGEATTSRVCGSTDQSSCPRLAETLRARCVGLFP